MTRSASLILVMFIISGTGLYAQDCAVNLRNAENRFNSGLVEEVPELLESCLESGFTPADQISAYKLIIRSYMLDDKTDMAEQMMLEFLKRNPEYEISPTDNADFIYLFNKFNVKPVIQLGVHGGVNLSYLLGIEEQSLSGNPSEADYANDNFTLTVGASVKFKLNERLELGMELNYSETSFIYTEEFLSYAKVEYSEKQRRLEAPVNVYYSFLSRGNFVPYVKGGLGVALNLSTVGQSTFTNLDGNNLFERAGGNENRVAYRKQLDMLVTAGFGCKYKLPSGFAFVDVGTSLGIRNQTVPGVSSDLEHYYFYTDDKFRLNTMRFSAGYIFILYKPERIQE